MNELTYQVIRSDRKTIAIRIDADGQVIVSCPRNLSDWQLRELMRSKETWIRKQLENRPQIPRLTEEDIRRLADQAMQVIPERVRYFAPLVGVDYGRITIRNQRSRWGSCSAKGNLNFNCLLMLAPAEVLDYVVVHELCHRKEMNHSLAFWKQVERVMPDYRSQLRWLRDKGGALIAAMKG